MAWTLDQLLAECARILAGEEQPSGRVTDAPDLRTFRYYTTLGLVDAPRAFDKKKGLYDDRHLHQLLAIKRLQRTGLALADIQSQLAGATDARLRTLSQIDGTPSPRPTPPDRFWARKPRALPPVEAFRVAPGITLIADGTKRPFTDDDAHALRAWLAARGLTEDAS